ncbi:MAG: CBS domain-containing protein [Chloroflexi bacterium]|nr:CBS domain-containing protein [Chloroflexota bacterium]
MLKAFEVMSRPLATCAPDTNVTDVAAIMRDRDIGDVLIVEDGKLRGIVTDRDLTLQALTSQDDPRQTPVSKYMSTKIVTGESTWNLTQVSSVMAEHQIRRLPIVQDGKLVGIISLGDVARYEDQTHVVAKSLQAISEPLGISSSLRFGRSGALSAVTAFALAAMATTVIAWLTWNHSGQALRKQISDSEAYHTALDALSAARDKVDEAASSKQVRDFRHEVGVKVNDLAAQLPTVEYKPARRKHAWFA